MTTLDLTLASSRNLGSILEKQAQLAGDRPCLLADDAVCSYAEADAITNSMANGLRQLGVGFGDRVALLVESGIDAILVTLAVSKLGAVWIPVNTEYRGAWLEETLARSRPKALIVDAELLERIEPVRNKLQCDFLIVNGGAALPQGAVSLQALKGAPPVALDMSRIGYGDTAAVLWTSGTTGRSKGVMQSHNAWIRSAESGNRSMGTRADDVVYNCLPIYNSGAWTGNILRALVAGIPCAIDARFSVSTFWDRVRFYGATQTLTIGAMHMFLWKLPERPDDADNTLRVVNFIPVPYQLILPFCRRYGIEAIVQGFGQSEIMAMLYRSDGPGLKGGKPGALGSKCHDDFDLALLDDEGQPVAPGAIGEFCIRQRTPYVVFNGYLDDPEATRELYSGEWYRTGDLGRQDQDGDYYFFDRKKDCVRYKGRNISSFEVESTVRQHPAVQDVAAFGVPSAELESESELKLDIVLKPGAKADAAAIARFINDNAPYYVVPRYIEFAQELPYTPTRKLQKFKLREKGLAGPVWDRDASGFELKR